MLPPGHAAAGMLTAAAAIKFLHPALDEKQLNQLLIWGGFWAIAPDFDAFYAFYKTKALKLGLEHRSYVTHRPVFWVFLSLVGYGLSVSAFWKANFVLMMLGGLSHFLLDSIEFGVPWLWPFSYRLFALISPDKPAALKKGDNFFDYWFSFLKLYLTRPTFYAEVAIVVAALIFLKS